ncbi:hypothetical protein DYH09_01150 [bacterium CPR1]|nr:hypothetical protein [bacterium CPR1]
MRLTLCGLLLTLVMGMAAASQNDWLIVPGKRVGPITATTSRSDLERMFGKENLRDEKVYLVEGQTAPGTLVYPKDPKKRLAVVWNDPGKTKIEFVKLTGSVSEWRSVDGITLGTRLSKLEQINGKPITFLGFGWDYGGNVTNWNEGALDKKPYGLALRLSAETARRDKLSTQEGDAITGDQSVQSDHPAARKLDPWVDQMVVSFR